MTVDLVPVLGRLFLAVVNRLIERWGWPILVHDAHHARFDVVMPYLLLLYLSESLGLYNPVRLRKKSPPVLD